MPLSPSDLIAALAALQIDEESANSNGWASTSCPACGREGESPSLRVNVRNGSYTCFRCKASSSNVPLHEFSTNPRSPSLSSTIPLDRRSRGDLPPLDDDLVLKYHRFLLDSPSILDDLEKIRGWTRETVERIGIGWDGDHMWIPIRDQHGRLKNARLYDPFKRTRLKSFHYANESGLVRTMAWVPFGPDGLNGHQTVWLFEGEPDGVLASQMGFPAALVTGGAGTWTDELLAVIGDKRVVICYDTDAPGRRGSRAIAARLRAHGISVVELKLDLSDPSSMNDFTDAVLKDGRDARYFKQVAAALWKEGPPPRSVPPLIVPLGGGVPGEIIAVKAHVIGTHTVPILVPSMITVSCKVDWQPDKACRGCPCGRSGGRMNVEFDAESMDLAVLCSTRVTGQEAIFRHSGKIPARCPRVSFDAAGMWQVQPIKLIPPMTERQGGDSTMRAAMFVAPADGRPPPIKANSLYEFVGRVAPDVNTNEWTLMSSDAEPAEDDIDSFGVDEASAMALSDAFHPVEWTMEAVELKLSTEERCLARHVTKIYGRDAVLRAIDLVYHTVVRFPFRGDDVSRGWGSLGVVGDTRVGKSETFMAFANYLGLGKVVIDPANTTYAGLVGGLQQIGRGDKSWVITWGLIPSNDRGLVVIDEVSSLSVDDIGRMSGMRSAGIAEITKIRSASTMARTRLVMSGNPRGFGMSLSSYSTPVEAFMDLIGTPEDVARFDAVMAVRAGLDKEAEDARLGSQPMPIDRELRRSLIKFAWSRRPHQVTWEDGAEKLVTRLSSRMIDRYDSTVPIVEPSEQDLRLARLAVAAAVRTYSVTDDDPNIVFVRKCHVEFANSFMMSLLDGDLRYDEFSEFKSRMVLDEKAALKAVKNVQANVSRTCRALLSVGRRVNPNSIGMVLALDGGESRVFISALAQIGAAEFAKEDRGRNTAMTWTPAFLNLLRRIEADPSIAGEPNKIGDDF